MLTLTLIEGPSNLTQLILRAAPPSLTYYVPVFEAPSAAWVSEGEDLEPLAVARYRIYALGRTHYVGIYEGTESR